MALSKFTFGLFTGIVAGVLLAPDKGSVTRRKISTTIQQCKNDLDKLLCNESPIEQFKHLLSTPIEGMDETVRMHLLTVLNDL